MVKTRCFHCRKGTGSIDGQGTKIPHACSGGLFTKSYLTLVIPWTVAHQAPLSMGFPRQEYRGMLAFPSPGDLPDPGTKPQSPTLHEGFLPLSHQGFPYNTVLIPWLQM